MRGGSRRGGDRSARRGSGRRGGSRSHRGRRYHGRGRSRSGYRSHYYYDYDDDYHGRYYWYYYPFLYGFYNYYDYYEPSREYYHYYYDSPAYYPPADGIDYGYQNDSDLSQEQQQDAEQDTFDDVREKLAAQRVAEAPKVAERLHAISKAFKSGDYAESLNLAEQAVTDYPYHPVLEFAYSHALFANGMYDKSAAVLREAIRKVDIQRQPVIFGAELYPDYAALTEKVDSLRDASRADSANADLKLLLGYQLAVAGRRDEAQEALSRAKTDYLNGPAAAKLEQELLNESLIKQ